MSKVMDAVVQDVPQSGGAYIRDGGGKIARDETPEARGDEPEKPTPKDAAKRNAKEIE